MIYNIKHRNCNINKQNVPIYKVITRKMHRATGPIHYTKTLIVNTIGHHNNISNSMSTLTGTKLKKKAITDLANDDTGNHTHIFREVCVQADCETKQCPKLCDKLNIFTPKGHNTHNPPVGRFCRYVFETDANGKPNAQYFVTANEKKPLTAAQKTNYGHDVKPDIKQQSYINKHYDTYDKD